MKMSHIRSKQVFVDFYTFVQLKKNVEIVRKKVLGSAPWSKTVFWFRIFINGFRF